MNSLITKVGSLNASLCTRFIQSTTVSSIADFLASIHTDTVVSDITPEMISAFVENYSPVPVKAVKTSDSKSAWLGWSREYRACHKDKTSKQVGAAWKKVKGKLESNTKEWARLAKVGSTKVVSKPRVSSGTAWNGFRSEFADLNEAKNDDDESKILVKKDITGAASVAWDKGKGRTEKEIKKYQKLAAKNKALKDKLVEEKKEKIEKAKAERAAKKLAEAKSAADESDEDDNGSDSDSGSDDEDEEALGSGSD